MTKKKRTVLAGRISAALGICSYVLYISDMLANPQKDKSLTGWIIWCVVGFLILKSYIMVGEAPYAGGEHQTADSKWLPLVYTVGPPVILLLLYFKLHVTTATFTVLDWAFLTVSVLSGVYLWVTKESLFTLHVNMAIDVTGSAFVAANAWQHPGAESIWAWIGFSLAGIANLFAVKRWQYRFYIYPVAVTIMCLSIFSVAVFH